MQPAEPGQGRGGAGRDAGGHAGARVAFTDADLSYAPDQLLRLLAEVEAGWDVVVGQPQHTEHRPRWCGAGALREVGGRVINLLTHAVLLGPVPRHAVRAQGVPLRRRPAALRARPVDGFAFDVEVFHLVERYRLSLDRGAGRGRRTPTASTVRVGPRRARACVRDLVPDPPRGRGRAGTTSTPAEPAGALATRRPG